VPNVSAKRHFKETLDLLGFLTENGRQEMGRSTFGIAHWLMGW
jgi:hypothetical protein